MQEEKKWVCEWRTPEGVKCKKFYTEFEADDFADGIFEYYPTRVFKETDNE